MPFFLASSASDSTSLTSSPDMSPQDNLNDEHNPSPTTQGGETLPTLADSAQYPFSRATSDINTITPNANPALDPFTFDVDVGIDESMSESPPTSGSSPYSLSPSGYGSTSSPGSGGEISINHTPLLTLGEGSHSVRIPGSMPLSPPMPRRTMQTPVISSRDKGKWRADPDTSPKRSDELDHRRTRSSDETKTRRSTTTRRVRVRRVVDENGISRDFLLIVALCVGLACAAVLVARPAVMAVFGRGSLELYDV